jgi:carbonic anhydrase
MQKLLKGFLSYRKNILPQLAPLFRELADGQNPSALFFACSDSRFDPNLVTSSLPGQIFVHRSVGNLIPPADGDGVSHGDFSEASAIEYAVDVLGVEDVVVFGHSACGAMKAALGGLADPKRTPNLEQWLKLARPALSRMGELPNMELSEEDRLSQTNVLVQLEHAATYPAIQRKLAAGSIRLHGAWFEVVSGEVFYLSVEEGKFLPLIAEPAG